MAAKTHRLLHLMLHMTNRLSLKNPGETMIIDDLLRLEHDYLKDARHRAST